VITYPVIGDPPADDGAVRSHQRPTAAGNNHRLLSAPGLATILPAPGAAAPAVPKPGATTQTPANRPKVGNRPGMCIIPPPEPSATAVSATEYATRTPGATDVERFPFQAFLNGRLGQTPDVTLQTAPFGKGRA
jgi:hypothetical protein